MNIQSCRIGILMGGPSSEREISLRSGGAVYQTLSDGGFNVFVIDILSTKDVKKTIKRACIDIAFIALHGRFGEDGKIQAILEELNIPYTGSGVKASELALKKSDSKLIFEKNHIPTPCYRILKKGEFFNINNLQFPIVVKPSREGSSIGLSIVEEKKYLDQAIRLAYEYDDEIILEEYINGKELTVGILEERALAVIQIEPKSKFYDYTSKYTKGMTEYLVPAPISQESYKRTQELGMASHRALGCRVFSRVDIILEEKTDRLFVLEVNTIPGLTSTSLLPKAASAEGISFLDLCIKLLNSASPCKKKKFCFKK